MVSLLVLAGKQSRVQCLNDKCGVSYCHACASPWHEKKVNLQLSPRSMIDPVGPFVQCSDLRPVPFGARGQRPRDAVTAERHQQAVPRPHARWIGNAE